MMPNTSRPALILDTDGGVDDAMALLLALAHPSLELLSIGSTFGQGSGQQALDNAIHLCALAGRRIPVHEGAHTPLRKTPVYPDPSVHGVDGLGNLPLRSAAGYAPGAPTAARFIVSQAQARPGQVALLMLGPLTNLAQALRLEPRLPALLGEVFVSGGSILAPGHVTPVAETNVWHDPHAADAVFTAGFRLTQVGLDVAHQMPVPLALFEQIAAHQRHPASDALLHAARFYADSCQRAFPELAQPPACLAQDLLALLAWLQPELFVTQPGRIRVVCEGLAEGQTILDRRANADYATDAWGEQIPLSHICLRVDAPAALACFERLMMQPGIFGQPPPAAP